MRLLLEDIDTCAPISASRIYGTLGDDEVMKWKGFLLSEFSQKIIVKYTSLPPNRENAFQ